MPKSSAGCRIGRWQTWQGPRACCTAECASSGPNPRSPENATFLESGFKKSSFSIVYTPSLMVKILVVPRKVLMGRTSDTTQSVAKINHGKMRDDTGKTIAKISI